MSTFEELKEKYDGCRYEDVPTEDLNVILGHYIDSDLTRWTEVIINIREIITQRLKQTEGRFKCLSGKPVIDNTQRCKYATPQTIEKCIRHISEAKTPQLPKRPNTNPEEDFHENHVMEWEDAREAEVRAHVQQAVREWPFCGFADAPVELEFDWKFSCEQDVITPYFVCPYCSKEK
jgi:hypothetical protein